MGVPTTHRSPVSRRLIAALVAFLALTAFACGGGDDSGGNTSDAEAGAGGEGASGSVEGEVVATDFKFAETEVKVDPGTKGELSFTNEGETDHTFTVDPLEVDVTASPGQTESVSFEVPDDDASFPFYCKIHPDSMTGTLIVGEGSGSPAEGGGGGGSEEEDDSEGPGY